MSRHETTTDHVSGVSIHMDAPHRRPDPLPALLSRAGARAAMTLGDLTGIILVGVLSLLAYALLGMGMPW